MSSAGITSVFDCLLAILTEDSHLASEVTGSISFNPFPPRPVDIALVLTPQTTHFGPDIIRALMCSHLVREVTQENVFLNVNIHRRVFLKGIIEHGGEIALSPLSKQSIAVEHSSFTPAYPLNLSTARIAAVGHALSSIMRASGYCVSEICWCDDKCKQHDLVEKGLPILRSLASHHSISHGKADHIFGAAFLLGLSEIGKIAYSDYFAIIDKMFPFWRKPLDLNGEEIATLAFDDVQAISPTGNLKMFEQAFLESLKYLGIEIGELCHYDQFRLQIEAKGQGISNYSHRGTAFVKMLLARYDRVVSVVNARQEHILSVISEIKPEDRLRLKYIWCGDVTYNNQGVDRIKELRFSDLDSLLQEAYNTFGRDEAARAIRLLLIDGNVQHIHHLHGDLSHLARHNIASKVIALGLNGSERKSSESILALCLYTYDNYKDVPDRYWKSIWLIAAWDYFLLKASELHSPNVMLTYFRDLLADYSKYSDEAENGPFLVCVREAIAARLKDILQSVGC